MRWQYLAAGMLLVALAGCGGEKLVPVSGVVTLDGKPYGKAVVSFQPIGSKDNPNPGRGSSSYTDENGRFVLRHDEGTPGAVPGKHRVRIMTRGDDVVGQAGQGSPDETPKNRTLDPIPTDWVAVGREFDVPTSGTDKADFEITSVSASRKK